VKRLLVTGVSGLLGLNLAWLARDRFLVTGVLRGKRAVAVPGCTPFEVLSADLTCPEQIEWALERSQPDWIIHCAALTDVDHCEAHPEEAQRANAWLPGALAQTAAQYGVRLLHLSTDAVFDGQRGNYTESDSPSPINAYGRSKLEGERAVVSANPDALIARVNFYGWSWQGKRSLAEYFYNNLSVGQPVFGFHDLIFCPLLVNDLVEILLSMLDHGLSGLYHVVSAEAQSKFAFARMLAHQFGFDEAMVTPASYKIANMTAPRSPLLSLRSEKLVASLPAQDAARLLSGQEAAMRRFVELYHQGYPQALHALLAEPNSLSNPDFPSNG
jgi:dTDP-4-dehydrorhamnose reductase